jgi:hypothetical protein
VGFVVALVPDRKQPVGNAALAHPFIALHPL